MTRGQAGREAEEGRGERGGAGGPQLLLEVRNAGGRRARAPVSQVAWAEAGGAFLLAAAAGSTLAVLSLQRRAPPAPASPAGALRARPHASEQGLGGRACRRRQPAGLSAVYNGVGLSRGRAARAGEAGHVLMEGCTRIRVGTRAVCCGAGRRLCVVQWSLGRRRRAPSELPRSQAPDAAGGRARPGRRAGGGTALRGRLVRRSGRAGRGRRARRSCTGVDPGRRRAAVRGRGGLGCHAPPGQRRRGARRARAAVARARRRAPGAPGSQGRRGLRGRVSALAPDHQLWSMPAGPLPPTQPPEVRARCAERA